MMEFNLDADLVEVAELQRGKLPADFFEYRDLVEASMLAGVSGIGLRARGEPGISPRLIEAALTELKLLLCTDDAKYVEVRQSGSAFSKAALPAIAGYVAATVGVTTGVATAGTAFLALMVLKVGVGVFCRVVQE